MTRGDYFSILNTIGDHWQTLWATVSFLYPCQRTTLHRGQTKTVPAIVWGKWLEILLLRLASIFGSCFAFYSNFNSSALGWWRAFISLSYTLHPLYSPIEPVCIHSQAPLVIIARSNLKMTSSPRNRIEETEAVKNPQVNSSRMLDFSCSV